MNPIHQPIAAQELEIANLRAALITANTFNTTFPGSPAAMTPTIEAWILYRLQYLMALQAQIMGANLAPAVVAAEDVPLVTFANPLTVPSNAVATALPPAA